MARVLILAEGETERLFVRDILAPHLLPATIYPEVTVIPTRKVADGTDFKGGIVRYEKIKGLLRRLLYDSNAAMITTLFDYYGLPDDFPKPQRGSCYERVNTLENSVKQDFSDTRLHPFFFLHEFEAMMFVSPDELVGITNSADHLPEMQTIKSTYHSPEEINDHPDTAPSRRIKQLIPSYRKTAHGLSIIQNVGLDSIRVECPHFNEWLTKLESLGQPST